MLTSGDAPQVEAPSLVGTTCERCGAIELPLDRVLLRVHEHDDSGVCVIRCPTCGQRFVKPASDAMILMLLAVGVEVSTWSASLTAGPAPAELGDITHRELEEFRHALDAL